MSYQPAVPVRVISASKIIIREAVPVAHHIKHQGAVLLRYPGLLVLSTERCKHTNK